MLLPCHATRDRDYILNDERRMTNDETNPNDEIQNRSWPITGFLPFGFCNSFDIGASSFCYHILSGTLISTRSNPRCKTRAVRSHNPERDLRAGSWDFSTR